VVERGEEGVVGVEQWAELRREYFVRGVSIKELVRRTGLSRNTVRPALRSSTPPRYERAPSALKLDPFKDEIHRLLKRDPRLPGQRGRELITPLGFDGGKTIVDDYLREVRPFFAVPRTYQRTVYPVPTTCPATDPFAGRSGRFECSEHLPENRGVPGSSPGLAIQNRLQTRDLPILRMAYSASCLGTRLGTDGQASVSTETGRPVFIRVSDRVRDKPDTIPVVVSRFKSGPKRQSSGSP
jgi:transcriptional regulator with XRE-family HTH domain